MSDRPRAFEFVATFPSSAQPYKPHGDGGGALILEWSAQEYETITAMARPENRGKRLRVLIELLPTEGPVSRVG